MGEAALCSRSHAAALQENRPDSTAEPRISGGGVHVANSSTLMLPKKSFHNHRNMVLYNRIKITYNIVLI